MNTQAIDYADLKFDAKNMPNSWQLIYDAYKKGSNIKLQIIEKDLVHLQWIYDRLSEVHGENINYDYMIKFKSIIEHLNKNK